VRHWAKRLWATPAGTDIGSNVDSATQRNRTPFYINRSSAFAGMCSTAARTGSPLFKILGRLLCNISKRLGSCAGAEAVELLAVNANEIVEIAGSVATL
jgi:hypothetical protein